jgi:cytochrome c-type biogenesis protein CcmE
MKPRHKKLAIAGGLLVSVGAIAALVLNAFQSNLVFFYSPSQIASHEAPTSRTFRLGGLVQEGSVKRDGVQVSFVVTDTAKTVPVRYEGILPDLFKEGKGVVAQGSCRAACSLRAKSWPSTTRTTCLPRLPKHSRGRKPVTRSLAPLRKE